MTATALPKPPQNIEAEEAILGSLLIDSQHALSKVRGFLRPHHFYLLKHRWIYEAGLVIFNRQEPLDYLTLTTELERRGQLAKVGGPAYIARLANRVPTALHVETYAHHIHESYLRRFILQQCTEAARLAHDTQRPIDQVAQEVEAAFLHLRDNVGYEERLQPLHIGLNRLYDEAQRIFQNGVQADLPTGIASLDTLLGGGLHPGTLSLVAARPGVGKSIFLAQVALHTARQGKTTALFSLEMPTLEVVARVVQREIGLDYRRLQDDDWQPFTEGLARLTDLPLWLDDTPALAVEDLVTKCRRLYVEHKLGLVLLDYTQLVTTTQSFQQRYRALGHISRALKALALDLNLPVVAAAQLGRDADHRRPVLGDLRESGDLEQDADIVIFLHRPNGPAPSAPLIETEILLAKHRQGPDGSLHMALHRPQLRFVPLANEEV